MACFTVYLSSYAALHGETFLEFGTYAVYEANFKVEWL